MGSANIQAIADAIGGIFVELSPVLTNQFVYVNARTVLAGNNFSLPAPLPSIAASGSIITYPVEQQVVTHTFVGRSGGGRRNVLPVYGVIPAYADDYVYSRGEVAALDNTIDYLNTGGGLGTGGNIGIAIDGLPTSWYDRVTLNYNDYWVRQVRK
jgi:hypothetical protein